MLDFVRKHTRIVQVVLLPLIALGFVLVGIQGYTKFRDTGDVVATVDGQPITQAQWERAQRHEADRMRAQMPRVDAKLFDTPRFKEQVLDNLIQEQVLLNTVTKERVIVSNERLIRLLATDPNVAPFLTPEKTWNKNLLAATGQSAEQIEENLRTQYALQQVMAGVLDSALMPSNLAQLAANAMLQKREIQTAAFNSATYSNAIHPTEADLQKYYNDPKNAVQFMSPERVNIEYVVLNLANIEAGLKPQEEELRHYYEQNLKQRYTAPEERRASHILIKVDKAATPDQRQAARAKAQALLAQVQANPNTFAEVAKKHSEDPVSGANGGDLDYFGRGAMTKPFEDAVFALKKNQISDLVESDFGYHIIRLTDVRGGESQSFDSVRPDIEAEIKKQQAQKQYSELAARFNDLVYEQSDSLKPVAEQLKLTIQTSTGLTRADVSKAETGTGKDSQNPLANAKFLQALFDQTNMANKRNTEAIEIAPYFLVAGRVTQHEAAHKRSFAEVKAEINSLVVAQQAADKAYAEAEKDMQVWKKDPAKAHLSAPLTIARNQTLDQPAAVIDTALKVPAKELPTWHVIKVPEQGSIILKVNKVIPADLTAPQRQSLNNELKQLWADAESRAYFELLKQRYKAKVEPAIQAKLSKTPELAEGAVNQQK